MRTPVSGVLARQLGSDTGAAADLLSCDDRGGAAADVLVLCENHVYLSHMPIKREIRQINSDPVALDRNLVRIDIYFEHDRRLGDTSLEEQANCRKQQAAVHEDTPHHGCVRRFTAGCVSH